MNYKNDKECKLEINEFIYNKIKEYEIEIEGECISCLDGYFLNSKGYC